MADSDRNIRFVPTISPEEAERGFKRLAKSAQDTFNKLSLENPDQQLKKLQANLAKTVANGEKLSNSLEKAKNVKIPTDEYKQLQIDLKTAEREYTKLLNKQEQFIAKGKEKTGAFEDLQHQAEVVAREITNIEGLMEELQSKDLAFTVDESKIQAATAALESNNNQIRLQEEALANLQQKQSEMSQQRASQLSQEVDSQAQQIAKMLEIKLNAGEINSEIGQTVERLKEIHSELSELQTRQAELEAAGAGLGYEEYDHNLYIIRQLNDEQSRLNEEISQYRTEQERGSEAIDKVGKATESAGKAANKATSGFSKLAMTIGKLAGSFITSGFGIKRFTSALSAAAGKSQSASFSFKKLFTTLLRYGIGIRSIYALFNKIRGAITENIQYFALWNNGMNRTNSAISAMQSSLNALKGALAGAFVPIITTISPLLSNLMDQLASVVTAIGMFIAKLTGAKSYLKAVKKDVNYAAGTSAGKAGQSAQDKQEKAIAKAQDKYDKAVAKAQQKYEDDLAKTREKNSKAQAKAEEKQAKAADKLAKAQKRANSELSSLDKLNVINTKDLEELEEIQADVYEEPELNLPSLEDYMDAIADSLGGGGGSESPFDMIEVPLDNIEWQWDWDEIKNQAEKFGRDLADKLNSFFEDENFAKDLGHNIAEALNTALSFAYGFVTQFDWKQFGHWLGTLIQEGLETFEWDKLGKVIGELVNGLADTIKGMFERYKPGTIGASIGTLLTNAVKTVKWGNLGEVLGTLLNEFALSVIRFFQEYPVGTIGASLAEMLNNAIKTVNPENLGIALSDILKAPFIELSNFFTETNWTALGDKLSRFISNAFSSKSLNNQTLGETIGTTLGNLINAGSQFLLGFDAATVVANLVTFFTEAITTALFTIKWEDLFQAVWKTIIGILTGLIQGVIETILDVILKIAQAVMDGIIDYLEQKYPLLTGELEKVRGTIHDNYAQMKEDMHEQLTEATRETVNFFTGTSTSAANSAQAVEASSKRFNSAIADMIDYMTDWSSGAAVDWDAALQGIQREFEFTDEDMDTLIGTFGSMDEKFNDSDEILTGYTGSWEEYKKTISDTSSQVKTDVSTSTKEVTKNVEGMGKDVTDSINKTAKDSGEGFKKITESAEKNLKKDKFTKIGQNNIIKGLASAIRQTGPATSAANQTSNIITNTFRNHLTATILMPVGGNLISGLVNGMMSRLRSALDSIRSICNQITSTVKAAFDEHSPSKVFAEIGKNLMLGLEGGVDDNADEVTDSFDGLVPSDDMLSEFADKYLSTMENLTASVSDMFDGMSEHISGSLDGLGSLQKFKNFKGNMSISSMAVPGIAQGFKLPSSLELKTNGDSLSTQLPGMLKSAMLEALQEGYTSDLTEKSIIINIDGKNVFEAVRNQDTKYKKQHGASAFG